MATATMQVRSPRRDGRETVDRVPSEFLVFQNNSGGYHWAIVSADGMTLAQSSSFASFDDAEQAALQVRDGAASLRVEGRGDGARPLVVA